MTLKHHLFTLLTAVLTMASCQGQATPQKALENNYAKGDTVQELGNSIMVVHQDKRDNYWFGSWETGVYKYDGKYLVHYSTEHGLPNNRIDEIKEDTSGNIYFTSCHPSSTISRFDGNAFTTLSPVSSNAWELTPSDMWFKHAYRNEKVYRYDGNTLHELCLPKPPSLFNSFEIYSIYKDRKGNVWFGTNPVGVCRYDGKSFDWIIEEDVTEFRDEGANGVRSITEDQDGNFWFNTEYRYRVYDKPSLERDTFYTRLKSIGGLDGKENSKLNEYLSAVRDDNDDLWFVTYRDGVWKFDGTNTKHYAVQENSEDITLFSIYKDNTGSLWLGTHENGVYKFNGVTFERFVATE
ncbi:MAG: hypothetical protein Salg2KO_13450 [Salibacteraceae bacterium]